MSMGRRLLKNSKRLCQTEVNPCETAVKNRTTSAVMERKRTDPAITRSRLQLRRVRPAGKSKPRKIGGKRGKSNQGGERVKIASYLRLQIKKRSRTSFTEARASSTCSCDSSRSPDDSHVTNRSAAPRPGGAAAAAVPHGAGEPGTDGGGWRGPRRAC